MKSHAVDIHDHRILKLQRSRPQVSVCLYTQTQRLKEGVSSGELLFPETLSGALMLPRYKSPKTEDTPWKEHKEDVKRVKWHKGQNKKKKTGKLDLENRFLLSESVWIRFVNI